MAKVMTKFRKGHIVRYTRQHLRNTGQVVGAPINGLVTGVDEGLGFPLVQWCDREESVPVAPGNLELDPKCKRINEEVA